MFVFTVMIYFLIKLKSNVLTIQKLYSRNFGFMAEFVDAWRLERFFSKHFKRWQTRMIPWLSTMHVLWVSNGILPKVEKRFIYTPTLSLWQCGWYTYRSPI